MVRNSLIGGMFYLAASAMAAADQAAEEQSVRQTIAARWAAQAKGDVEAFSAFFAEDADFVNVRGARWRGRAEIAKNLGAVTRANVDSDFSQQIDSVRFVRPDVAIVHVSWHSTKDRTPDGRPLGPRKGIVIQVLAKQGDRWYVSALQNTLRPMGEAQR